MRNGGAPQFAFGDFVFDVSSGDLHRGGSTSRLAPQVAAVLRMLAGRQGEVVTRAELRDALWPETTVEFDQGLNFCIRQLRLALGDDAAEPRYIETLHRRGYRFVAEVREVWSETADAIVPTVAPHPARRRQSVVPFVVVLVAAIAAAIGLTRVRHYEPEARLAVLYFDAPPTDTLLAAYRAQLAEALIATAGRGHLNEVAVMGPSFTARFAGTSTPPDTIRAAIGATHVLSGVLRREARGTRVFAQLIRTSDQRHIYAARFIDTSNTSSHMLSIADSIARAVTMIVLREHL
jgi:DNA-binding winged helix-turn-helix (wHTH) protein/TolB-like protein